ncbi:hypothetical protein CKAH01_14408 [Colletotrichum kahawae]|uniref:Uncharacterized protein n=1 Tax=Colletotrichum kahawae TaxID=34407 RepID=A0AAD9YL25_COLKA|nr:hypothetical protein CKAH01_14408 [Colletotrichum kahawae]
MQPPATIHPSKNPKRLFPKSRQRYPMLNATLTHSYHYS